MRRGPWSPQGLEPLAWSKGILAKICRKCLLPLVALSCKLSRRSTLRLPPEVNWNAYCDDDRVAHQPLA